MKSALPRAVLIRLGYDLSFDVPAPTVMTTLLHVHPSLRGVPGGPLVDL